MNTKKHPLYYHLRAKSRLAHQLQFLAALGLADPCAAARANTVYQFYLHLYLRKAARS